MLESFFSPVVLEADKVQELSYKKSQKTQIHVKATPTV